MKKRSSLITVTTFLAIGLSCLLLQSCSHNSSDGGIIITRIAGNIKKADFITGESWRVQEQAQIVLIEKTNQKVLTSGFYSACSPDISYDGKLILFAGQMKKGDPWRIWELKLSTLKVRAVTPEGGNCIDPVYIPGNRIVFSKIIEKDSLKAGYSVHTCNLNGSDIKRISYNPYAYFASNLLADGRILTIGRELSPETGKQEMIVMRPDGTKAELFYMAAQNGMVCSRSRETSDGKVVFIESEKGTGEDGSLISINYSRPLHTRTNLSSGLKGNFLSVFPEKPGRLLVCYRKSGSERYGLYEFDTEKRSLDQNLYESNDYNVIDAVAAVAHARPRKLPSEIDMHVKSGLLLCQDINVLNLNEQSKIKQGKKAVKIEVLGLNGSLGIVDVEKDGSFQIKPLGDTPFRIRTLDENGKEVNGPCGWIYLRPNERRGCVGCHEDPELTPFNRVSLSVKKQPVIIPVHIDKIKEKKVDLE